MAFVTAGYETRNSKKKWNSLVSNVNNDREVQRMLQRQRAQAETREAARQAKARADNAERIERQRRLNAQAERRRQQQRDYATAYKEKPRTPKYEQENDAELARFRRRQAQILARWEETTLGKERRADIGEFGLPQPSPEPLGLTPKPGPAPIEPEPSELQPEPGPAPIDPFPKSGKGKPGDEALINAITNLNLSSLETDQMYAILHSDSVISTNNFSPEDKQVIDSIRDGDLSRINELGDGAKEKRQKIIETSRELLAMTIPGKGFNLDEQDPDTYEPLDWRAIVNRPSFTMLIKAEDEDLDYVFHIAKDPVTGEDVIIDNSGSYLLVGPKPEKGMADMRRRVKSKEARRMAAYMSMGPMEVNEFGEEWYTYYLNKGLAPNQMPELPYWGKLVFTQIVKEYNTEMFNRFIAAEESGFFPDGTPFTGAEGVGEIAPMVMTESELTIGTMAMALSGGFQDAAVMPNSLRNRRESLEARIARTKEKYQDDIEAEDAKALGEFPWSTEEKRDRTAYEAAQAELAELNLLMDKVEVEEKIIRDEWTPVNGFDEQQLEQIELKLADAKEWYDANTTKALTTKSTMDFSFGIGVSVADVWDTVAHPEAGKIPDINLTEIPIIGDAIKKVLANTYERAKQKLGHEPNQLELNQQKADDEKLMAEVRLYEQFLQLNGQMTERGMDNWMVGNIGGSYIALKTGAHYTELGYSEVGHPISEQVMPVMADMVAAVMSPVEGGIGYVETAIETASLGKINVPSVEGFTENVREVISGDVDLFFGIDSTEVVGELLNPSNFFFIIPFIGVSSKFGQAVRAGKYAEAAFVLVDEMVATGNSPELISGAFGGLRSIMVRGLTETLIRSPGLKSNKIWNRWMMNFAQRKTDEATAKIEAVSVRLIDDRKAIQTIKATGGVDNEPWAEEALKNYPRELVDQVQRQMDADMSGRFGRSSYFQYQSMKAGDLTPAPIRSRGMISRGIGDYPMEVNGKLYEKGGFRVDFSPEYVKEMVSRRQAAQAVGENVKALEETRFVDTLTSASGRTFSTDGVGRTGQIVRDNPLAHLSQAKQFGPEGKVGEAVEQAAKETGAAVNKISPAYLPELNTGFKAFAAESAKQGAKITKDSTQVAGVIKSETAAISKYSAKQLQSSRTDLEFATAKLVAEAGGKPTAEQATHFETIARQLDTVTTEMEKRYGQRAWRVGLDSSDDVTATRKFYDSVAAEKVVEDSKLYQLTDEEANTRFVELLIEAEYRAGHPLQKFDDALRAREEWVHDELNGLVQLLGERGFRYEGSTFVKGDRALGWAGTKTSSKVNNQIEQTLAGSDYAGKLAGSITGSEPEYLVELRHVALAARRTSTTPTMRKALDDLLTDIANELGRRRELEEAHKAKKVVHEPIERGTTTLEKGADEGAELPRMADTDVSPETLQVTIRNAGDETADTSVTIGDELTTITLDSGLKIQAKLDPQTGGIWVKIVGLKGGRKAIPVLEEGLNDLRNFAEDNNKVIRGWARPFGKGENKVDQKEVFDIYERNGFLVERDRNSSIRPWKEFEYRPYVREGEVPDKSQIDIVKNLEHRGEASSGFVNVDDIIAPDLWNDVTLGRPNLGRTANGVWEGTKEEAEANLRLIQERLSGRPHARSAFSGEKLLPEDGRSLQRQAAKWERIIDNDGKVNIRLEELWDYQNELEMEVKALKAKYWREASPEDVEAKRLNIINEFEDEAGELDPRLAGDRQKHLEYLDNSQKLDEALDMNWKAIKIADAGRTFSKQNIIATEFKMSVDAINAARPQKEGGGYLLFIAGRKGKGGGDKVTTVKSIEDVYERKARVDTEVKMLTDKQIPQGPNFARDTLTIRDQRLAWGEYKRQIDELVTLHVTEKEVDGAIVPTFKDTTFKEVVPKYEPDEVERYARQYLIDPERGDIGSSSIQERTVVSDRAYSTGITDVFERIDPNEDSAAFFDDVVEVMIRNAQEISANQKRQIFVHAIDATESSTGMREVSVFGITKKGREKIEAGTWEGKNVGLPKKVEAFIAEIDGKSYKGKKKAFIDDIFKKSEVESGWTATQRGRMQLLRADTARLDSLGAKPSNVNQRFLYNSTYDDLISGISHEVSDGLTDVSNRVGKQLEVMNVKKSSTLPSQNSLMDRNGEFVDLKDKNVANVIEDAWNEQGQRNPDWPGIRDSSLVSREEEQVGKVSEALRQTGWVVIKRESDRSIRFEITGEITTNQAKGLRKIIDDGDYSVVDVVQSSSYGKRNAENSHLAKLKGKTDLPKEVRATGYTAEEYAEMGIKPRSTTRAELDKKINDLVNLDMAPMQERLNRIGAAVDGAESFGDLPPGFNPRGDLSIQQHFIDNGPGRKFRPDEAIPDGTGIIFPDGSIWVDRPRRIPVPKKGEKPKKSLVGTTKDGVRTAFGGTYDMTEQEMDEFFIEFLNNTGGMRFRSTGGQVEIIVNRPPSRNQLLAFGRLKNPEHERRGYEITLRASDGEHAEKMVMNKLTFDDFDKAGQGLLEMEARVARSKGDGWSVLRAYREQQGVVAKEHAEVSRIESARESGTIPKKFDDVDVEDGAGNKIGEGKLIGTKNKSVTYKDGRGKELTASVYNVHKKGPVKRPIVKKTEQEKILDEVREDLVEERDQISVAIRDQDGKGYIIDNSGNEYRMAGKGDDIFDGRGMFKVSGGKRNEPLNYRGVKEVLDENRTVVWERPPSEPKGVNRADYRTAPEDVAPTKGEVTAKMREKRRQEMLKGSLDKGLADDPYGEAVEAVPTNIYPNKIEDVDPTGKVWAKRIREGIRDKEVSPPKSGTKAHTLWLKDESGTTGMRQIPVKRPKNVEEARQLVDDLDESARYLDNDENLEDWSEAVEQANATTAGKQDEYHDDLQTLIRAYGDDIGVEGLPFEPTYFEKLGDDTATLMHSTTIKGDDFTLYELEDGRGAIVFESEEVYEKTVMYPDFASAQTDYTTQINKARKGEPYEFVPAEKAADEAAVPTSNYLDDPRDTLELRYRREEIDETIQAGLDPKTSEFDALVAEKRQIEDILVYRNDRSKAPEGVLDDVAPEQALDDVPPTQAVDDVPPEQALDDVPPAGTADEGEQLSFIDENGEIAPGDFEKQMAMDDAPPPGTTDDIPPPGTEGGGIGSGIAGPPGGGRGFGGSLPEGDARNIIQRETDLERAAVLRQKGQDLVNSPKAKGEDFDKGLKMVIEADEIEASLGLTKEVGSMTGPMNSTEKSLARLQRIVDANSPGKEMWIFRKGRKVLKMADKGVATNDQKEAAKRMIRAIKSRRKLLGGRIESSAKRQKQIKKDIRNLKKGHTSRDIQEEIELLRWELIKEEETLVMGIGRLSPVEQMQEFQLEMTRLARVIENEEAGHITPEVGAYARRRFENLDRSVEWIRRNHEERYLIQEKQFMGEQMYQTGLRAHRQSFEQMRGDIKRLDGVVDDLVDKGLDRHSNEVQKALAERQAVIDKAMEKRKDIGDAVATLVFPKEGSGVLPTFQDFENIQLSRGFIGQKFEDALNTQIRGIRHVMMPFKSLIGFYDNTLILRSDALGRKILAMRKLENFARTQDAKDANKIMALGDLPFKLDKKTGNWLFGKGKENVGISVADAIENPLKYGHLFNDKQANYIKVIREVIDNTTKFSEFYAGTDIAVWKEANKIFRQVISSKNGLLDFDNLKRWKMSTPDSFHQRFYETMLDGVTKGVRYEFDPTKAVIHQMQAIRSYAINKQFMKQFGDDFGIVRNTLKNQSKHDTLQQWKSWTTWAKGLVDMAEGNTAGQIRKITSAGLRENSEGNKMPNDLVALRNRLLVNFQAEAGPEKTKIADQIYDDAVKRLEYYKNGNDDTYHKGLKWAQERVAKDDERLATMKTTGARSNWNVRELQNRHPNGDKLDVAPSQWGVEEPHDRLFLQDDLDYLWKHWGEADLATRGLSVAGRAAGVLRIPQTALDWGFPLINGLNNWGYDVYRSTIALAKPGVEGIPGEASITAFPLLHPVFKLLGKKYKQFDSTSIWGESMWQSALSFASEKGGAKYWARENSLSPEIMSAYEKYGRVAGLPHEFQEFGVFEKGEKLLLGNIPGAKSARFFERFQSAFTQYINVASYMYFKSLYHTVADNPKQLEELGALSRNMIGMHAGAELGIGKGQLAMERVLFYAPSFTRASFAIMANAGFQPNSMKGRQALKSLAGLGESMVVITAAYSMMQQFEENGWSMDNMNWEDLSDDMVKAWTPGAGFWGIEGATGVVGLGGAMRSNMQLIFRLANRGFDWSPNIKSIVKGEQGFVEGMTSDFAIHPEKFLPNPFPEGDERTKEAVIIEARDEADELNITGQEKKAWINGRVAEWEAGLNKDGFFDHPVMKWYRGKAGIISGNAWDMVSGHDFLGFKTDFTNIPDRLKQFFPFYVQAAMENRSGGFGNLAKTFIIEFFGARVIPPSPYELKMRAYEEGSGLTREQLYEVGKDGYMEHSYILNEMATNEEDYPEQVQATQDTFKVARGREQDYQLFRDERTRYYQERDAQIADLVAEFDWNDPKHADRIDAAIDTLYSNAEALVNDSKLEIFGDDGKQVLELWEGLDVEKMSPQAALDYASKTANFTDKITGDIEWDIREAFINKHVKRLPPQERAIYLKNQASHVGQSDVENYKAGKYDFVNQFIERRRKAGDDFGIIIDSGKYKGLDKEAGLKVDALVDTVAEAARIIESKGFERYTHKEILIALNESVPGNITVQYALMSMYDYLKPMLISTVKFDMIMENPDIVIFHPGALEDWSLSDRQREQWADKWGLGGLMGGIGWDRGTSLETDLYRDKDGLKRRFGFDVDVEYPGSFAGVPTETKAYTDFGKGAVGTGKEAAEAGAGLAKSGAGVFKSVGEELDEYIPGFLK